MILLLSISPTVASPSVKNIINGWWCLSSFKLPFTSSSPTLSADCMSVPPYAFNFSTTFSAFLIFSSVARYAGGSGCC